MAPMTPWRNLDGLPAYFSDYCLLSIRKILDEEWSLLRSRLSRPHTSSDVSRFPRHPSSEFRNDDDDCWLLVHLAKQAMMEAIERRLSFFRGPVFPATSYFAPVRTYY
jgi:hypothetical protein